MRKCKLFIAMSLDGYIADDKGKVDWLKGQGNDNENIDSYSEFVKEVDTILMGWNTYYQIVNELSINEWIYEDFMTYVITHKDIHDLKNICFTNKSPVDLIKELKTKEGKDIWICGGATLVHQLIENDIIDVYYITVIPIILGFGIRLFERGKQELLLKLIDTRAYNGMVDLVYIRR